nr:MAG TPA: transmembrane protein [Caudoviricetes sp.]
MLIVLLMISLAIILLGGSCWIALSIWKAVFALFV